jgi:hypothetical protein
VDLGGKTQKSCLIFSPGVWVVTCSPIIGLNTIRLVKAAMAEASKQATSPKRKQLRNVSPDSRFVLPLPLNCTMRPAATGNIGLLSSYFSLTWSRRKQDQRVETATAFPAVPNMTGALIAPVLRPFGGDQLITALNAFHPEVGTRVGTSHPHVSLHTFAFA